MLRFTAAILTSIFVLSAPAVAQRAEDSKTDEIGPWEIEATFKSDKFDHCAISRTVDEIAARFVRTNDGVSYWSRRIGNWSGESIIPFG
jgi:hypothetical protein